MAATVQIVEKNGAGAVLTDKTSGTIRFKNADNATVDTTNPMVRPGAGSDWSYEKWLRFNVSGGSYTSITNIRAYTDGGGWTGINLWAKAVTAYSTPAEGSNSSGYSNAFGYTSVSPITLGSSTYTSTGEKGDHLVMLMEVTASASGGLTAAETLTWAWDEI